MTEAVQLLPIARWRADGWMDRGGRMGQFVGALLAAHLTAGDQVGVVSNTTAAVHAGYNYLLFWRSFD